MSAEIEAAVIDGHRAVFGRRPKHVRPIGSACPNCDVVLQGPWCHACGQSAEELHRSVLHLGAEAVEGFTHFDGRFWRTLPALIFNPARLTRDYIQGHRASQIPPLRLFLVVLLIVFFAGSIGRTSLVQIGTQDGSAGAKLRKLTPEERAKAQAELKSKLGNAHLQVAGHEVLRAGGWMQQRLVRTLEDPERFGSALETWGHRFAFIMLPVSALILTPLFLFQRRFYVFDHLIFSMHSLAFQGVLITPFLLFGGAAGLLVLLAPVHLFLHMRGTYETSVFGTLVRMALLFVLSAAAGLLLLLGLLAVGLNAMGE